MLPVYTRANARPRSKIRAKSGRPQHLFLAFEPMMWYTICMELA